MLILDGHEFQSGHEGGQVRVPARPRGTVTLLFYRPSCRSP